MPHPYTAVDIVAPPELVKVVLVAAALKMHALEQIAQMNL